MVADSFYGEDEDQVDLRDLGAVYVLALKPSHGWWHREGEEIGALWRPLGRGVDGRTRRGSG